MLQQGEDPIARVAVYFAPACEGVLWHWASRVIGYDAATGEEPSPAGAAPDLPEWPSWTEEPRLYGFHATLKAPFRLAEGKRLDDVAQCAERLAKRLAPFRIPRLDAALIGRFVALVPAEPSPALADLAAACVREFEPLRAQLTEAERERRLEAPLTPRQTELLDLYGYPYVLDQFRFHMTLTGKLPPERAEDVRARLAALYAGIEPGLSVESICLFVQPAAGARFRLHGRFALAG